MKLYATISWNVEHGFIKTWDQMLSAQLHNGRCIPVAHAVVGAPEPEYLIGSPNIVAAARQRLVDHGIDPDNRREGGNIAREAILSASREFFFAGSETDREQRLKIWKEAQPKFLNEYFGAHRIISAVVHYDEYTPHVHAIVLALKFDANRKRGPEWSLCGDDMSKFGHFARHQTHYAHAMAPFGLARGEEGSPRKTKPHGVFMDEMNAAKNALTIREQEVDARQARVAIVERKLAAEQATVAQAYVDLRDGWTHVTDLRSRAAEEGRQAASARAAAAAMLKEAVEAGAKAREEAQAEARASERRLEHGFDLLRQQRASADARETDLDKRERALKVGTGAVSASLTASQHHQMTAAVTGLSH